MQITRCISSVWYGRVVSARGVWTLDGILALDNTNAHFLPTCPISQSTLATMYTADV